jgi:glycerol-3-phosphate dehydrogenase (NAD(P)+)
MSIDGDGRTPARSTRVTVVGAGAWGTTLAILAHRAGSDATLLVRDPTLATELSQSRRHPRRIGDADIPAKVRVTADPDMAFASSGIVIFAVPIQALREVVKIFARSLDGKVIVNAGKGLERNSLCRPTQVIVEELALESDAVCALSGPNLAAEIVAGQPAATVVAARDSTACEVVRIALMSPQFRVYTSRDIIGVEMGGALKNIIAIGAGIGDGLGAGDNAKAAFLTRGIAEIARLGIACGAEPLTFAGLSGIGDLIATCASPLSRNNRVGRELARGRPLAAILKDMDETAEGVPTTEAAYQLGLRLGVELPITAQMHDVLFAGKPPLAAIRDLMIREPKQEQDSFSL